MKDLLLYGIYAAALLASFKMGWLWWNGKLSATGAFEWFSRGYFFAWGAITAMLVALLMIKLIVGWVK